MVGHRSVLLASIGFVAGIAAPRAQEIGAVRHLAPAEVAKGAAEGRFLLVDVREPDEVAAEAYPDAVAMPMSAFQPARINPKGRQVVFVCRSGRRSDLAARAAIGAGLPYGTDLAGGIEAWKAAGLPVRTGVR